MHIDLPVFSSDFQTFGFLPQKLQARTLAIHV
jgi:hypothetical protein